ncbi:MAG: hypothetical protein IPI01_19300 [Ignavibacteriae bacterium]|nr:hypothetical protein [Ignavibacteriota bacterium]
MDFRFRSEVRASSVLRVLLLLTIGLAGIQCDESLPPVVQPAEVLTGTLALRVGANGFVLLSRDGAPVGTDGAVEIMITNQYDEVLSDSEDVQAEVVIFQSSHPGRRDTIHATKDDIQDPSMLIRYLLAIPPTKPLEILRQWPHRFSGDSTFISAADEDTVFQEKGVEVTAYKVRFTISARVKLFKKRQSVIIEETPFTVFYRWGRTGLRGRRVHGPSLQGLQED